LPLRQAQQLAEEAGMQEYQGLVLFGLARVAQANQELTQARQLAEASVAALTAVEHFRLPEVTAWLAALPPA
ncbi:MAG: hypothetical protein KC425_22580, partial [Anaerolineales bacterium]|nr:hypothetical protein [Anaerolineales bacterium]